ncbi:MAG: 30S ribosomal protein S18 [Clostridia bacterium]|nr:30S ribosomal protein S18 [Clostridia bacterium]
MFKRRRRAKYCVFCANDSTLDYKDEAAVKKYISDRGKILPRRATGNCAKHQRMVAGTVKRARQIALVPFVAE